jgi:Protein of unknown function (DUF3551)
MRIFALATLIIATLAAAAPARAQTYDPAYPVCMHVYGRIVYYDCRYSSIPQCKAAASGRAAQCDVNPYFVGLPPPRRQRHTYYR